MFNAPPVIETTVFASLPDALRKKTGADAFAKALGRPVDSFLEGPSFDKNGALYCVDVAFERVFRIDQSGRFEEFVIYDGQPNGLKIHKDGRIFIADRRKGIVVIDPESRKVAFPLPRYELESFKGPNDLVFAPNGDLYFTDQGMSDYVSRTGRVFRLRANGQLDLVLDALPSPNGIAIDASGRHLFVALTRTNSIIRALIGPDGKLGRVQNFIQLSGGGGPDGIAVTDKGGLVIAHPMMGAVWIFDALGEPILRVNTCRGLLGTNIAFGGPDRRRLFITESETGTIQCADLPVAGVTMYSHA